MVAIPAVSETAPGDRHEGWLGALELSFVLSHGRTIMKRRSHRGPFVVQSAFYPEGAPCHAYLLHPPGGLVGGDRLRLDIECAAGTHALITTPAAGKVYRSAGAETQVRQHLRVEKGATLEFLPTEAIVFDGARCTARTHLDLQVGATVIAWDAWVMGRPASGDGFASGRMRQSLELSENGQPLLLERNTVDGGGAWLRSAWGLGGRPACVTFLASPGGEHALEQARRATGIPGCDAAVTLVDGVLVGRAMAAGLVALRRQMERWWRAVRPVLTGRTAVPPRIWAT